MSIVKILLSYIGVKGYTSWAESIRGMERKDEDDSMPTTARWNDYGTVNAAGVFNWHADAVDTENEYNRDYKIWERNLTVEIKQWKDYINEDEHLFLAIQGQVEPFVCDKPRMLLNFQLYNCQSAQSNLLN